MLLKKRISDIWPREPLYADPSQISGHASAASQRAEEQFGSEYDLKRLICLPTCYLSL